VTPEQIDNILKQKEPNQVYDISFKARNAMKGLFLKTTDYRDLSRKNLWRIVSEKNIEEFQKTANHGLARIFNGTDITKLGSK